MCTLPQKVDILAERVDLDMQNNNNRLAQSLCEGVVKYLAIKKLFDIYEENGNETAFAGLKDIFAKFYDLREVIHANNISEQRLWDFLGNRGYRIDDVGQSLSRALERLALRNAQEGRNERGRSWCVHLVFASKALHTFNNELPIVDTFIDLFFDLDHHNYQGAVRFEDKCLRTVDCYNRLMNYYSNMEEYRLNDLIALFSEIMNNERAFDAANCIEHYANAQNDLFDALRPDENVLNAVVEYAGNIDNTIHEISSVKKIDFMVWNYWRTVFEKVNAANLPEGVELIQGDKSVIKRGFDGIDGTNNVSAIDIGCSSFAKNYVKSHSEKFYKIYLVNQ